MLFNVVRLPVLSIVAIVVAPYLKTKTPPISEIVKFVVATLVAAPVMLPVPPLAIGRAPLSVMLGVVPPEEAKGAEAVTLVTPEEIAPICACTNAVVAICVVFVLTAAVGARGTPVNVGLAERTVLPVPVEVDTPVPPFATRRTPGT